MRALVIVVLLLFAHSAFAGSNSAELSCTGIKTPISLKSTIPASEEDLNLTFSDKTGNYLITMDKSNPFVVENLPQGVFTLLIDGQDSLVLYALPKTINPQKTPNGIDATFQAILESASRPALRNKSDRTYDDYYHHVKMNCRYHYSI